MACCLELACKSPHGEEKGTNLLDVMLNVLGLGQNFHQYIQNCGVFLLKPGMLPVELVTQDEP
jgi:sulfur relay (sulfurtransferase) DsrF/TusC family protein